ncbi:MAG: lytic transglycosylase domain-containing protein [Firmicutes bacterium]|nr:lytic transglycosylase domain-containing protein [Bacillota bacterium]MBQ3122843.1 lytic transglycosylase domain-containing protein [Bacillota bacterium]
MTKKLVIVWLTLIMVLFSSISIYADEDVQGDFFEKHVIINGEEIINYNLQYPFLLYNDTTYFPLTPEMGEILGVTAEMDWESRTLKLLKTDSTRENISSNWLKNNNVDPALTVVSGAKVLAFVDKTDAGRNEENNESANTAKNEPKLATKDDISLSAEGSKTAVATPELSVTEIDLGGLPVLAQGKNLFLPVRAMTSEENFNWDIYFDAYYGICISTDPEIPAKTYADQDEILLNKGLVLYMRSINTELTTPVAQHYLFLFKRAGEVYDINYRLLIAMSSRESNFKVWATSRSGALGMMQIMPKTGAYYGLTKQDLYNEKINIDFGAMYISDKIHAYGGDWSKGLSAYNQGVSKVNRGTHSTVYADKVIGEYYKIGEFLETGGYVAQ